MPSTTSHDTRVRELLTLTAVIVTALLVRVLSIGSIPANLMLDEADNAQDAYRILVGRGGGPAGLDWSQAPLFSMYILAGCIRVFGDSVAGLRSMPVLLSVVSLIPFFYIARRQVGVLAAGCGAFLLATSLWYLHFSRTAWINMTAPLFALGAVYFLTRALADGRWRDYLACGVCVALGVYGYPAGRSIPIAVLAALPLALLLQPQRTLRTVAGFAVAFLLAAALIAPHVWVVANSEQESRLASVSVLAAEEYLGERNRVLMVVQQVGRNLAGFILLDPGQMGRGLWAHYLPPGRTVLDHGTGVLFWIGLIVAAWRWRDTWLWWLFLLVPVLTVQVFSMQTPDAGRGLIVAPFMYLFVALALDAILARARPSLRPVVTVGVLTVVVLLAALNLRKYFDWIGSAQALNERQPAVALAEFPAWSELQRKAAAKGRKGFGVMDWRARIDNDGCKNGTLHGSVCRRTDLLPGGVENRALTATSARVDATPSEPRPTQTFAPVQARTRPPLEVSSGASPAERDQVRRRDLSRLSKALKQLYTARQPFPSTNGKVQSVCYYDDDAGCSLYSIIGPIPVDPRGIGNNGYWYRSDGTRFTLYAVLEEEARAEERCAERPDHIDIPGEVVCLDRP